MIGRGTATGLEGHKVGDRVVFYRDLDLFGTVTHVEKNGLSVKVLWDGLDEPDFQWANKVVRLP